jgi:iron-sulfur cluster repair protein YtfE (RIC family)
METITTALTNDHRYADGLFAAAVHCARRREWPACAAQLALFRTTLESHIKIEEEVLFPAFERATGTDAAPTAVMRTEHRELLETLAALNAASIAEDGIRFDALVRSFSPFMAMHSTKEEHMLYPICDRMVGEPTREQVVTKLQQWRAPPRAS